MFPVYQTDNKLLIASVNFILYIFVIENAVFCKEATLNRRNTVYPKFSLIN